MNPTLEPNGERNTDRMTGRNGAQDNVRIGPRPLTGRMQKLPQIEFELSAEQFALMGYPRLQQGLPLTAVLDGGVLLPQPGPDPWYAVQKEPLTSRFTQIGPALYAFAGQIIEADIQYGSAQMAVVVVDCGFVTLRVACAPNDDGVLPEGTWETRHAAGFAPVQAIVEESFSSPVGRTVDLSMWGFRRLLLSPNDSAFGTWHPSSEIPPAPFTCDRLLIQARVHRQGI